MNKEDENIKSFNYGFFPKNHRGQFFLIAAVVIIVVVVSIVTISNYSTNKQVTKLYDLGKQLGIESQNVLDYGTYNNQDPAQIKALMEQFIQNYHQYQEEARNIYFVFGNSDAVNVVGYQDIQKEYVCLELNPKGSNTCPSTNIYSNVGSTQTYSTTGQINDVAILIGDPPNTNQYEFKLKSGENFYFVIWQNIGGEKHVVTSDTT